MCKIFMCLCMLSFMASFGQGETGKVSVQLYHEQNDPLNAATVEMLRAKDSNLVKTALSEPSGLTIFEQVPYGSYILRVSSVGLETSYSQIFTINESGPQVVLPAVHLKAGSKSEMQGITVTAKKPFIQKLNDRIVVNVENSIMSAGSSALDVLERSPGITIDDNDALSLRGKAGVTVMIDGKPTPMSSSDLASFLRGLPASAIERIDIITNPSARYDAAGNSGIIDIRMKKDQRMGTNGTINLGIGQGIYPKANAGTSFNYRNKKFNVFGNYNYSYRKIFNHLFINRNFYDNGDFTGSDDKDNSGIMPFKFHQGRLGADFFPSNKTIIGFLVSSNFNHFQRNATNSTIVNDINKQPESRFVSLGTNNDHSNNTVVNLNFKHSFDSLGRELTADVDYGTYDKRSLTRTASSYYDLNGDPKKPDDVLDGDQSGRLELRTAKADYILPFNKNAKLEAGYKTSYVHSDNNALFFNVYPTGIETDNTRTNRFFYTEYNNAGYVNFSREYKKINFQLGLRGEKTDIRTRQVKDDKKFSDNYFELFPSAFFNYKLKEEQTLGVSVSRRIDRPGYSELNPFLFQIDPSIYATGNPFLKAQMTWSYELSYTRAKINFSLGYSHTKAPQNVVLSRILDVIPNFEIAPGADSNITVEIPVNLGSSDHWGFTANTPLRITRWWNMVNNFNFFYNNFKGNLGGVRLDNGSLSANIRTNNNFSFSHGWSAELTGSYNSAERSGYMLSRPQWGVGSGVQKNLIKGKGTLRLNVTDIFWTNLPMATISYPGRYVENWHAKRETRVATLSFTYRFGNNKVQGARKRTTASEEERQRAGGN